MGMHRLLGRRTRVVLECTVSCKANGFVLFLSFGSACGCKTGSTATCGAPRLHSFFSGNGSPFLWADCAVGCSVGCTAKCIVSVTAGFTGLLHRVLCLRRGKAPCAARCLVSCAYS